MELIHSDNIETAIAEGYFILELDSETFSKERYYNVYKYFPNYIIEENQYLNKGDKYLDTSISWNELLKKYKLNKVVLDKFNDRLASIARKRKPSVYDLLELADSIDVYFGLE